MSWIESTLTRLETRLRAMIEGEAGRDGISRKLHNQLLGALFQAMLTDANSRPVIDGADGQAYSLPDQYTLVLPTQQAQLLLTHPTALDRLSQMLEQSAAKIKIPFLSAPMLRVVADPNARELQVFCEHSQPGKGDSLTIELEGEIASPGILHPLSMPDAFLIVNGLSTYRLTHAVINIGSDLSNQLVLEHPRVSRLHAQLRFATGRFTIFDLDSKEGTFVNGVAVSSHQLNPGDVIKLAGVPLVYGEENTPQVGLTQKLPAEPPPPEVM